MDISAFLDNFIKNGDAENIAICVGQGEEILLEAYRSNGAFIDEYTKFDMASVTKILATTVLSLIAIDRGVIRLEDRVSVFFDCPEDKSSLTVKHLLTHTMGIGYKKLFEDEKSRSNIAAYILHIPSDIPIGSDV